MKLCHGGGGGGGGSSVETSADVAHRQLAIGRRLLGVVSGVDGSEAHGEEGEA